MFDLEHYAKDLPWHLSVESQHYGLLIPALAVACNAKTAIEIGIAYGWTSVILARSLAMIGDKGLLLSCDTNEHYVRMDKILVASLGLPVEHWALPCDSKDVEWEGYLTDDFQGRRVDLAIIDGDHSYETCSADLANTSAVLSRGGFIVCHDYLSGYEGVDRAVGEFLGAHKDWHCIVFPQDGSRKIQGSAIIQAPIT